MKKFLIQFLIFILLFLGLWWLLAQLEWKEFLKLEERGDQIEEKLGEIMWEVVEQEYEVNDEPQIKGKVDTILTRIARENGIKREDIQLEIVEAEEINAFVMPDDYMVVFTGLIEEAENPEELAGVLAHELAHIEKGHIMEKLSKEIGMSVLIGVATGDTGGETARSVFRLLASNAFSRQMEEEADQYAVKYLLEADIDPDPFATLMYRISEERGEMPGHLEWFATHPDPETRAVTISEEIPEETREFTEALPPEDWQELKELAE